MSRIRTIKPEFFKHEDLFDAEVESGLPLRLAFAGLWTQCDREGRFVWRPRQLKVDILPYDDADFSRVLDALATRGFVVKYTSNGRDFGHIPSWRRHQVVNNRETASTLPEPSENIAKPDASTTRGPRVGHAGKAERKGKERKGKIEPNGSLSGSGPDQKPEKAKTGKRKNAYSPAFEAFWQDYPRHPNMSKAEAFTEWQKLDETEQAACHAAVPGYIAFLKSKPDLETIHACRFISKRRFEGYADAAQPAATAVGDDDWRKRLNYGRNEGRWSTPRWGPAPGKPECRVPQHLLQPTDGADWREWELAA